MDGPVVLRPMAESDSAQLLQWRNQPHVAAYMYTDHVIGQEEHDRWFAKALGDENRAYWICEFKGLSAGLVNLADIDRRNRRALWAFYIGDADLQNRGIGGFVEYALLNVAFDEFGLHKLCAEVLSSNSAVINLHRDFGHTQEALYREHIWKGGRFVDVAMLAILRHEWEARRPAMDAKLAKIAAFFAG